MKQLRLGSLPLGGRPKIFFPSSCRKLERQLVFAVYLLRSGRNYLGSNQLSISPRISLVGSRTTNIRCAMVELLELADSADEAKGKGGSCDPFLSTWLRNISRGNEIFYPTLNPIHLFMAHFTQAWQALASIGGFLTSDSGVIRSPLDFVFSVV